jgi:hypothetical protein
MRHYRHEGSDQRRARVEFKARLLTFLQYSRSACGREAPEH